MSKQLIDHLNPKQVEQIASHPTATDAHPQPASTHPATYTKRFHESMGLAVEKELVLDPSDELLLRRGKLMLEETLETLFDGMGLELHAKDMVGWSKNNFELHKRPGVKYDPVETADGLADVNVVTNGTALELGIPIFAVDHEVFCSNMTKLDPSTGKPIWNECTFGGHTKQCVTYDGSGNTVPCSNTSHFRDPSAPRHKILKPDSYTPANVAKVLFDFALRNGVK